MKYANTEMKIDQIIGYFNEKKISLIPPFQRGSVWKLPLRRKLIENMVKERPIPAIFLYKKEAGSQFSYNILDGKQRLESLILFVGNRRNDMAVKDVEQYFIGKPEPFSDVNFSIELDNDEVSFYDLDDSIVRRFREYAISTIEIDLDDEQAAFSEIVDLFIDINQKGVRVGRFDVVKALVKDRLFKQAFRLIAKRKDRKKSTYFTVVNNSFTRVMLRLNTLNRITDKNSQVDRMWERFTEIALFAREKSYRAPADILKSFIDLDENRDFNKSLTEEELTNLRMCFGFLDKAYRNNPQLAKTRFATDQPQFYTLITTLLSSDLLERYDEGKLEKKLYSAAQIIEGNSTTPTELRRAVGEYRNASTKQTTHPGRRETRQRQLIRIIDGV
jgi:hypothetical protein